MPARSNTVPPVIVTNSWTRLRLLFPSQISACTTSLYITVLNEPDEIYRALMVISSYRNLRTLSIFQRHIRPTRPDRHSGEKSTPMSHPSPSWPRRLRLPHLRTLRISPDLPPRLIDFLILNCPTIEVINVMKPQQATSRSFIPNGHYSAQVAPALRVLDIGDCPLEWVRHRLNLSQSLRLKKVSTFFQPNDASPLDMLLQPAVDSHSLCAVHLNITFTAVASTS